MPLVLHTYAKPVKFVPDFLDNRKQKDPFWVLVEPCSAAEYENMQTDARGPEARAVVKEVVRSRILEVHNLVLDQRDGSKFTPTSGASLLDAIDKSRLDPTRSELLLSILTKAIIDGSYLSDGELDRFVSQSE